MNQLLIGVILVMGIGGYFLCLYRKLIAYILTCNHTDNANYANVKLWPNNLLYFDYVSTCRKIKLVQ